MMAGIHTKLMQDERERKFIMAKNWTTAEAAKVVAAGTDKAAIQDIGRRFPLFAVSAARGVEGLLEILGSLPDHVTVRKVEGALKEGVGEVDEDADTEDDTEEEEVVVEKKTKKEKPATKKGKKAKPEPVEEDEDEDEDDDEEEEEVVVKKKSKKEKPAAKEKAKGKKKKPVVEEDEDEDEDEDWDL